MRSAASGSPPSGRGAGGRGRARAAAARPAPGAASPARPRPRAGPRRGRRRRATSTRSRSRSAHTRRAWARRQPGPGRQVLDRGRPVPAQEARAASAAGGGLRRGERAEPHPPRGVVAHARHDAGVAPDHRRDVVAAAALAPGQQLPRTRARSSSCSSSLVSARPRASASRVASRDLGQGLARRDPGLRQVPPRARCPSCSASSSSSPATSAGPKRAASAGSWAWIAARRLGPTHSSPASTARVVALARRGVRAGGERQERRAAGEVRGRAGGRLRQGPRRARRQPVAGEAEGHDLFAVHRGQAIVAGRVPRDWSDLFLTGADGAAAADARRRRPSAAAASSGGCARTSPRRARRSAPRSRRRSSTRSTTRPGSGWRRR